MLNFTLRSPLRNADGAAAGGGSTGATGASSNPGTGSTQLDPSKFVSTEDFGKTAAMIRGLQKTLETLAGTAMTAEKLVEMGLAEKGDDGTYKPRSAQQEPGKKPAAADDPLRKELDLLKKQLADKDAAIAAEQKKLEENERNRAVIAALSKAGAVNAERDYVHLAGKVERTDQGFTVKGKDKYGTEVPIPIEEFAAGWLKDNPELLRAQAGSGSGTMPGRDAGTGGGNVIPKDVWKDPVWYQANRAKVLSGELQLGK
jgi:hypothetical protein